MFIIRRVLVKYGNPPRFNTGAIPQEYASGLRVAEDGIVSYGDYLYHKGENLEHYLANLGLTDQNPGNTGD